MSSPSPSLSLALPAEEEGRAPTKYVVITGGVTASNIGLVLETTCGLRVTSIKIDPYLNTDAGTSFEHVEVFVLDDDGEVDLDLGNYDEVTICICFKHGVHFLDVTLTRDDNITTGKIYQMERRGDYLGKTVQDEIKWQIQSGHSVPVDGRTRPAHVSVKLVGTVEDHPTRMAVFWDIENCNVPKNAQAEATSDNIRNALRMEPSIDLAKVPIRTYGLVPPLIREGLQRAGVIHIDILTRKKNAADMRIMNDMCSFALDNPPPARILLISGDGGYAATVRMLVNHGYAIVTALPSTASSDLITAGTYAWDWPSLARGEGIVIRESPTKELGILKTDMIQLFEFHDGYMYVREILSEYRKMFGQRIKVSDYHVSNLVELFRKMGNPFYFRGTNLVLLDMEFAQCSTSAMTVGPSGVPASVTEIPVSMNMQFDQGSTSGTSGVPDSVTETSSVNMEGYPCGPAEEVYVETEMVNEANEWCIVGKNLCKEPEKRFKD